MRRLILLITALWLLIPSSVWSYDLLIIQSQRSPVYEEVLRGFRSENHFSERVIVLTDYNDIDLLRITREENPIAIVTLGDKALEAVRKIRQTPVIALMALSYRAGAGNHPAMTGVEVQSPPERYLRLFASIGVSRIGIIYNSRAVAYIKKARKVAAEFGIDLVVREVRSTREVTGQLNSLSGLVDALWMLPDSVTSSGEAADAHFLFAAGHKLPVVTFSSAYLNSGAAIAVDIDRFDMGIQGGRMAASIINGNGVSDVPPESPRKITVKSNSSILRRLNFNPDLIGRKGTE